MPDQYENLPGFRINYKDGGLVVPYPIATTDSVLIIGTATDGPKYEPQQVFRPEDAEFIFGKPYDVNTTVVNGTTLMLGMLEAFNAGCRDVRLVRIGGETATATVLDTTADNLFELQAKYPGALYNKVKYYCTDAKFFITKPAVKGSDRVEIPLGEKASVTINDNAATPAPAITLAASDYGIAGNLISYKIDLTAGKFYIRETATATPLEFTIEETTTLTQLFEGINALVGNDFVEATLAAGADGTDVADAVLASTTDYVSLTGGINAITVNQLIETINAHTFNNVVVATLSADADGTALARTSVETILAASAKPLSGGDDGPQQTDQTYIQDMYHELYHAYDNLENYEVDSAVVLGVYADDDYTIGSVTTNFGEQIANFAANVSARVTECHAFIAARPVNVADAASIKAKILALRARPNTYHQHTVTHDDEAGTFIISYDGDSMNGLPISVGKYLSVVAMPELVFGHPQIGRYYAPGAAAYAGFVASLRPESAPTNKIIPNVRGVRYKLSNAQLNDLTGCRYVTFRVRNIGIAVTDGCTAADAGSDYTRLSTLRVTFAAVDVVRTAAEPFIGEPNELPQHNALETAIKAGLDRMKEAGAIVAYRFTISSTLYQKLLGESIIDLELIPALETRKIKLNVALALALSEVEKS